MAKTNTPFFSFDSHGSIANSITTQKRDQTTIIRTKPTPTYRLTLLQQYQRWLYKDYAYLWRQQSSATQQSYRSFGAPYHLTGFQYWMKHQLTNQPDFVLNSRLDAISGALTLDSSPHENHGTIFGASPATGGINGAFEFDGLNDYIRFPDQPYYSFGDGVTDSPFSIEALVNITDATSYAIACKGAATEYEWIFTIGSGDTLVFYAASLGNAANRIGRLYNVALTPYQGTLIHLCATYDGLGIEAGIKLFLDGVRVDNATFSAGAYTAMSDYSQPIHLARIWDEAKYAEGITDNLIIYDRELDEPTVLRHSLRRHH